MSGSTTGPTSVNTDPGSGAAPISGTGTSAATTGTNNNTSSNPDPQTNAQKLTQQISTKLEGLKPETFPADDKKLINDLFNLRKDAMVEHNNLMKSNDDKDKKDRDALLDKIRAIEAFSQVVNPKFPYEPAERGADDKDIQAQITRSAPEGFKYQNDIFEPKEGQPSTILGQMFQAGIDFVGLGWNVGFLTPVMMLASSAYTFVAGNALLATGLVAGTVVGAANRAVNSVAKANAEPYFKNTKDSLNQWSENSTLRKVLTKPITGSLTLLNAAGNFVTRFKEPAQGQEGYAYKTFLPSSQRFVDRVFEQSARLDTTLRFDKIVTEGPGAWLHNSIFSKVFYSSVCWVRGVKIDDIPPGIINSMGGRDTLAEMSGNNAVLYGLFETSVNSGNAPAIDPKDPKNSTLESTAKTPSTIEEDEEEENEEDINLSVPGTGMDSATKPNVEMSTSATNIKSELEPGSEAGSEPGSEAGSEPRSEAGSEAGSEPRSEAGSEAGSEPRSEAGSEAGSKASVDISTSTRPSAAPVEMRTSAITRRSESELESGSGSKAVQATEPVKMNTSTRGRSDTALSDTELDNNEEEKYDEGIFRPASSDSISQIFNQLSGSNDEIPLRPLAQNDNAIQLSGPSITPYYHKLSLTRKPISGVVEETLLDNNKATATASSSSIPKMGNP